jgi:hypothetical protein
MSTANIKIEIISQGEIKEINNRRIHQQKWLQRGNESIYSLCKKLIFGEWYDGTES